MEIEKQLAFAAGGERHSIDHPVESPSTFSSTMFEPTQPDQSEAEKQIGTLEKVWVIYSLYFVLSLYFYLYFYFFKL